MNINSLINNKNFQLCFLLFLSPMAVFLVLYCFQLSRLLLPAMYIYTIMYTYTIVFSFFTSFVCLKVCNIRLKLAIFLFLCFILVFLSLCIMDISLSNYIYILLSVILTAAFIKIIYSLRKINESIFGIEVFLIASFGVWSFCFYMAGVIKWIS
jgi:hypothetical protein